MRAESESACRCRLRRERVHVAVQPEIIHIDKRRGYQKRNEDSQYCESGQSVRQRGSFTSPSPPGIRLVAFAGLALREKFGPDVALFRPFGSHGAGYLQFVHI